MRTIISSGGSRLDLMVRQFVDEEIRFGLGRFQGSISLAALRFGERQDPDDGIHRTCAVTLRLRCGCEVTAEGASPSILAAAAVAIDRAAANLGRETRRHEADLAHDEFDLPFALEEPLAV